MPIGSVISQPAENHSDRTPSEMDPRESRLDAKKCSRDSLTVHSTASQSYLHEKHTHLGFRQAASQRIPKYSRACCNISGAQTGWRTDKRAHTELTPRGMRLHLPRIPSSSSSSSTSADHWPLTTTINRTFIGLLLKWRIGEYCRRARAAPAVAGASESPSQSWDTRPS